MILLSYVSLCLWGINLSRCGAGSEETATSALHVVSASPGRMHSPASLRNVSLEVATADSHTQLWTASLSVKKWNWKKVVNLVQTLPCSRKKNTSAFCCLPSLSCVEMHAFTVCQKQGWGQMQQLGFGKSSDATAVEQREEGTLGTLARLQSNSHLMDRTHGKTSFPHPCLTKPHLTESLQLAEHFYFLHCMPAPLL